MHMMRFYWKPHYELRKAVHESLFLMEEFLLVKRLVCDLS